MFNHSPNDYGVHEQYRQDKLRNAEQYRLIQIAKQGNKTSSFARKRLAWLGNFLVNLGQSMQIPPTEKNPINTISRPIS